MGSLLLDFFQLDLHLDCGGRGLLLFLPARVGQPAYNEERAGHDDLPVAVQANGSVTLLDARRLIRAEQELNALTVGHRYVGSRLADDHRR